MFWQGRAHETVSLLSLEVHTRPGDEGPNRQYSNSVSGWVNPLSLITQLSDRIRTDHRCCTRGRNCIYTVWKPDPEVCTRCFRGDDGVGRWKWLMTPPSVFPHRRRRQEVVECNGTNGPARRVGQLHTKSRGCCSLCGLPMCRKCRLRVCKLQSE